jgi:hypothetical protein
MMTDLLISWNNCCCHCDAEILWKNVGSEEIVFPAKKEWVFRQYECTRCRKQLLVFRQDECSFSLVEEAVLGSLYQCSQDVEPRLSLEHCDKSECSTCRFGKPKGTKRKSRGR